MKKKASVGRSEGELLRWIAEQGSATVTEAGDYLAATKGQTRNTALNTMERLRKKGFLERHKIEGLYRYSPAQAKEPLIEALVTDFVDGILGGSVAPLVAYLGRRTEIDEAELEQLRKVVKSLEKRERQ